MLFEGKSPTGKPEAYLTKALIHGRADCNYVDGHRERHAGCLNGLEAGGNGSKTRH